MSKPLFNALNEVYGLDATTSPHLLIDMNASQPDSESNLALETTEENGGLSPAPSIAGSRGITPESVIGAWDSDSHGARFNSGRKMKKRKEEKDDNNLLDDAMIDELKEKKEEREFDREFKQHVMDYHKESIQCQRMIANSVDLLVQNYINKSNNI